MSDLETETQHNEQQSNEDQGENLNNQLDPSDEKAESDDDNELEEVRRIYLERKENEESLLSYLEGLLKKKRKGYGEAKKHRMEKEEIEKELESLRKQLEASETEKTKQLQEQLEQIKRDAETFKRLAEERAAEKSRLAFDFAAEKHSAKDPEYVQFLMNKHLQDLSKDGNDESLKSFNVSNWMSDLKQSKPDLFGAVKQEKPLANSGLNMQSASTNKSDAAVKPISTNRREKEDLQNEWLQYKKQMGL